MTSNFLSPAQTQLFQHVTAWGLIPVREISGDPFEYQLQRKPIGGLPHTSLSPTDRGLRYLERMKDHETNLLKALGIAADDLHRRLLDKGGPTFTGYFWEKKPRWLRSDLMEFAKTAMDDLWQIWQSRVKVHERVMRWHRAFGPLEGGSTRPNVAGLDENLAWLQQTYESRIRFSQELSGGSLAEWNRVRAFYDPAERAAQNILSGAEAVRHFLKVPSR